jgi:uncharacterized repeat protein (TIGR03803 family)
MGRGQRHIDSGLAFNEKGGHMEFNQAPNVATRSVAARKYRGARAQILGISLGCAAVIVAPHARAAVPETVIHAAAAAAERAANGGLLQTSDGTLYGTARGINSINGSVFKISAGSYSTLLPFTGSEAAYAGLVEGPDGKFYGTLYSGTSIPNGALFRISTTGKLETLHTFTGPDGAHPDGPVVVAADGTVYGTTYQGGADSGAGFGTVFKFVAPDTLTTLYDFGIDDGAVSGANPRSRLVLDKDGGLYGTTKTGGETGGGTVFHLSSGGDFKVIAAFGGTNGSGPHDLLQICDGNLYGRAFGGQGIVFELTPSGTLSTLHGLAGTDGDFDINAGDGNAVGGALSLGRNGKLYGTAEHGGANSRGTVYELGVDGTFTLLYTFKGMTDGGTPLGAIQGNDGNVFGTYSAYPSGGVFQLTLPDEEKTTFTCPTGGGDAGAAGETGTDGGTGGSVATSGGAGGTDSSSAGSPSEGGTAGTSAPTSGGSDSTGIAGSGTSGGTEDKKSGGCSIGFGAPTGSVWPLSALLALALTAARRSRRRESPRASR